MKISASRTPAVNGASCSKVSRRSRGCSHVRQRWDKRLVTLIVRGCQNRAMAMSRQRWKKEEGYRGLCKSIPWLAISDLLLKCSSCCSGKPECHKQGPLHEVSSTYRSSLVAPASQRVDLCRTCMGILYHGLSSPYLLSCRMESPLYTPCHLLPALMLYCSVWK